MSVEAQAWAWQQDIAPGTKLVLVALGDHSDANGFCWPGIVSLAQKCITDRRTITRHLSILESLGLIRRQPRYREDGSQASNAYQLCMPHAEMSPPHDSSVIPPMTVVSPHEPSLEPSGYLLDIKIDKDVRKRGDVKGGKTRRYRNAPQTGDELLDRVDVTTLQQVFSGVNLDYQAQKCVEWWLESGMTMRRPTVAFKNWLEKVPLNENQQSALAGDPKEYLRRYEHLAGGRP